MDVCFARRSQGRWLLAIAGGLALCALGPARGAERDFWVSPRGDDAAPGTSDRPFRTLERARDAVRAVNNGEPGNIVVTLRDGTYQLEQPFTLDGRDSGRAGSEVVYRAETGAHPVISGAMPVTGWTLWDARLNIHVATVGAVQARQFYVNGRRATRARTSDYPAGFRPWNVAGGGGGIAFIPTKLNPVAWRNPIRWTNVEDIEAVIVTQWKMMRVPLESITPYPDAHGDPLNPSLATGLIRMQNPAWKNANLYIAKSPSETPIWSFWQVTWFENALQFLDEPGEWYLDRRAGWLYYIPRPGEDLSTAEARLPLTETLVAGNGTRAQPLSHVRFVGLTFSHATWLGPNTNQGYVSDQSGNLVTGNQNKPTVIGHARRVIPTPANVSFRYARNIVVQGNIFEHLGGVGLSFGTGSQDNTIRDNLFDDISAAAIQIGGVSRTDYDPKLAREVTRNNVIVNNLIRSVGREYYDAAGIYTGFTRATTIRNNTIIDVPWSGIAMGWGWGLLDPGGFPGLPNATPGEWGFPKRYTPNRESRILANRIENFLGRLWDGGAIYTTGSQGTSPANGLLIARNVASGKRPKGGGNIYYTDGGSRYITERNNVALNSPVGVFDFGPPPNPKDPLPYPKTPSDINGVPYGNNVGGCVTYGDIRFIENYWGNAYLEADPFFDICPYVADGVSYPTRLSYSGNTRITSSAQVPPQLLRGAGVIGRPPTIPADRWKVSP